jgi:hypothetical protein
MDFTKKTVRSRPGLSQGEALVSLQSSPYFSTPGARIASIKPRGNVWVAVLDIPKTAAPFPPSGDEGGESGPPKSEGGDEESSPDGPPSPDSPDDGDDSESGPPKGDKAKADKPGSDAQVVNLLTQILHTLGGGDPMGGMGGPDDLGPGAGGPPAPPPHGGPAGGPGAPPKGPGAMGAGRPLKPGEVPNKPGVAPIGSPAFSHTRQANPLDPSMMGGQPGMGGGPLSPGPNPMAPGATGMEPGPTGQGGTGACAGCGGPLGPDGSCPTCGGNYVSHVNALTSHIASKVAGRSRTASVICPPEIKSIKHGMTLIARAAAPYGYDIRQMKRLADGRVAALLVVR